jgi:hypothetical protein
VRRFICYGSAGHVAGMKNEIIVQNGEDSNIPVISAQTTICNAWKDSTPSSLCHAVARSFKFHHHQTLNIIQQSLWLTLLPILV